VVRIKAEELAKVKLKELLQVIGENMSININGQQYNSKDVSKELLDLDVVKVGIETVKPAKPTLEELGYSFEVGV
jgi:hypothetical protein